MKILRTNLPKEKPSLDQLEKFVELALFPSFDLKSNFDIFAHAKMTGQFQTKSAEAKQYIFGIADQQSREVFENRFLDIGEHRSVRSAILLMTRTNQLALISSIGADIAYPAPWRIAFSDLAQWAAYAHCESINTYYAADFRNSIRVIEGWILKNNTKELKKLIAKAAQLRNSVLDDFWECLLKIAKGKK